MKSSTKKLLYLSGIIIPIVACATFFILQNKQPVSVEVEKNKAMLEEWQKKSEAYPNDLEIKRELARAYYLNGAMTNSQTLLENAISSDEKNPQYYVDLGLVYQAQKNIEKAEELFKKAIDLNFKEYPDPSFAKMPLEEYKKEFADQFPPLVYKIPTPYVDLAVLYMNEGRNKEAISVLETGIKALPTYPDFYLTLSSVYRKMGDMDGAQKYKEKFDQLITKNH